MQYRKYKYTKTTYFVLPLLGVPFSCLNQGKDVFINCYLGLKETKLVNRLLHNNLLVVLDREKCDNEILFNTLQKNVHYITGFHNDNVHILVYRTPIKFALDIHRFRMGEYSKLSNEAKSLIRGFVSAYTTNPQTGKREKNLNYEALFPTEESRQVLLEIVKEVDPNLTINNIREIIDPPKLEEEKYDIIQAFKQKDRSISPNLFKTT